MSIIFGSLAYYYLFTPLPSTVSEQTQWASGFISWTSHSVSALVGTHCLDGSEQWA